MSASPLPPSTPTRHRTSSSQSDILTPTLPHSTSNRSLGSPAPHSPVIGQHPVIPKNYHPYQIQTTSSSLLTRSNSSPVQPAHSVTGHRSSRSMSNLAHTASPGMDPQCISESDSDAREPDRRRSMESPRPAVRIEKPLMRRSGTLPSFPLLVDAKKEQRYEEGLPRDPKTWIPSELARYLAHSLRTGGPDGTGHILPAPLVKDIETWVLREQVNGRAFLKSATEGWTLSSRAPPFLPLLQAISRKLRRTSLSGRLSGTESVYSRDDPHGDPFGSGSVLMEEEEVSPDEEITGVRRIAHAIEASSSASETDDPAQQQHITPLRPQMTGDSDRSEGWKRWSHHLGKSRARRTSLLSNASTGSGLADTEASPSVSKRVLSSGSNSSEDSVESEILSTPHLDGGASGSAASTAREVPPGMVPTPMQFDDETASFEEDERVTSLSALLGREDPSLASLTPKKQDLAEEARRFAVNDVQDRSASGSNPYSALTRASPRATGRHGSRAPTLASLRHAQAHHPLPVMPPLGSEASSEESNTGEDLECSVRLGTARRVTVRPMHANGIFEPVRPQREKDMEAQLNILVGRVKELEARLDAGTAGAVTQVSDPLAEQHRVPCAAAAPEDGSTSPLTSSGGSSAQQPRHAFVGILPTCLFMTGVAVGAVLAKSMLGRPR